jgi:hypothetical protein
MMFLRTVSLLLIFTFTAGALASDESNNSSQAELEANRALLLQRWIEFCDSLKATGERIVELDRGEPINTAEGFHYLAMLTGVAIERFQGYETPSHPQVARSLDTYKKMGLDSSDNTYRIVRFQPGGVYRVRGWRGNSTYLGFQLNEGISAVGNLNNGQMQFNKDGSFELHIGGEQRGANWMPLPEGADSMYIREIFIDWSNEQPSRLWIDRIDLSGPPLPLDAEVVADRLTRISEFVSGQVEFWNRYVEKTRQNSNTLPQPRGTTGEGGSADNLYSGGHFSLDEGEVLLIETEAVPSLFWNVQLGNNWFQSLDYRYRQTSLNSAQARPDSDGKFRVVVSAEDPGVPNWLDTAGRREGVIYYRWNMSERVPAAPVVKRIKLSELRSLLPADTPSVTAAEREDVLRRRAEDVARRFAL